MEDFFGELTRREALLRAAHLIGGVLSATTVGGTLAGCERGGETVALSNAPKVLSSAQSEMVLVLGEYVIPTTDTPGARAARVHEFIDAMLAEFYPVERRARFLAGLARVDRYAGDRFGRPFLELASAQQVELADALHRAAFPASRAVPESPLQEAIGPHSWDTEDVGPDAFMTTLKELVIVGYYTSRVGATEELAMNPMGVWRADIPYSEIGRAWA